MHPISLVIDADFDDSADVDVKNIPHRVIRPISVVSDSDFDDRKHSQSKHYRGFHRGDR